MPRKTWRSQSPWLADVRSSSPTATAPHRCCGCGDSTRPVGRRTRTSARSTGDLTRGQQRPADYVPHPRPAGAGRSAQCHRHSSNGPGAPLTKGANGVWAITTASVPSGAYRYNFNVDGVATSTRAIRRRASRTRTRGASSTCPAAAVGHDRRAARRRRQRDLQVDRARDVPAHARLHAAWLRDEPAKRYPVFYLLHGAGDSDDVVDVGRARRTSSSTT